MVAKPKKVVSELGLNLSQKTNLSRSSNTAQKEEKSNTIGNPVIQVIKTLNQRDVAHPIRSFAQNEAKGLKRHAAGPSPSVIPGRLMDEVDSASTVFGGSEV